MRVYRLLGLALVVACSGRRAPSAQGLDALDLAFAWPDELAFVVTIEDRVERVRDGERLEVRELKGTVPLAVRTDAQGHAVEVGRAQLREVRLDDRDISDEIAGAIALFDASFPSIRVGLDGAFLDLLDPQAAVATLLSGLAEAFSGLEVPPAVQQTFDELSVEPVRRRAAADWYALVEAWLGSWALGEERVGIVVERSDGEPDMPVEVSRAWLGRTPCDTDDQEQGCVLMRLRRTPTAEALDTWRAALEATYSRRGPVTVELAERIEEHVVVLRAEGLIPVRIERTSRTRTALRRADGTTLVPLDKRERRVASYAVLASPPIGP